MHYTPATVTLSVPSFTEAAKRVTAYKALYPGTEPAVFVRGTFKDERGELVFASGLWCEVERMGRVWASIAFYSERAQVQPCDDTFDIQIRG